MKQKLQKFAALVLLVVCSAKNALALIGNTEGPIGIDGNVRTLGAIEHNYDFPQFFGPGNSVDFLSQSLLRIIVAGKPNDFLSYEVHGVQSLFISTQDNPRASSGARPPLTSSSLFPNSDQRYRALDVTWHWLDEEHVGAALGGDRFNVKISGPGFDLTGGRQAISFGKTFFWSPLDVFSPFTSQQIDRDYKVGVDAAKVDVPFNAYSGMNVVGALGRTLNAQGTYVSGDERWNSSWYGDAVMGRAFTTVKGWDLSAQGGKIYGGYQAGGGTTGEVGPIQLRGEWAYNFTEDPQKSFNYFLSVVGAGHRFENTLDIQFEYFYNGDGATTNLDPAFLRLVAGETLQMSEHVMGVLGSYEITPIIKAHLGALFSPVASPSAQLQPGLTVSLSNEAELNLGAIINAGKRPTVGFPLGFHINSDFGTQPDIYYTEIKLFF